MPIERLRVSQLTPGERADLESALNDPDSRFFESRRLIGMMLCCVAAWLMIAEVWLMYEVRDSYRYGGPLRFFEGFLTGLPHSLVFLLEPEVLLFAASVALPLVIAALVFHAWHQDEDVHVLTSFALVRRRRNSLRLLRHAGVAQARIDRGWSLARCASADMLEVFATDGRRLAVYGHRDGLNQWKSRIDGRRQPTDTDIRSTA